MIQKSLRLLHLEKLLILAKEINFIENILKYYLGEIEKKETISKKTIMKLLQDIDSLKKRIKELEEVNDIEYEENIKFVIFYDYTRIQIEEILLVIDSLYTKMNQLFGEMLNQYLPYPTFFGRRYSSNGLMMFLDNYYQYISTSLEKNIKSNLVLGWSYNNGFRYKVFRNKDIKKEGYNHHTYNDYIELPYWYYELPFLIPAITHEVVEIAIREKENFIFYNEFKKFNEKIDEFLNDKSNEFIQYIGDIIGYDWVKIDLTRELFADLISYRIHSKAYLFTLFHNLLGEYIAKDFIKVNYQDDGVNIKDYDIKPNDWIFNRKRDFNHLRLYFLTYLYDKDIKKREKYIDTEILKRVLKDSKKNNKDSIKKIIQKEIEEDKKYLKEMKELLNTIMNIDINNENITGFEKMYYNNFPNYYNTYEAVKVYLKIIYSYIIKDIKLDIDLEVIKDKINIVNLNFDELWEDRFNTIKMFNDKKRIVPYKGKFRQMIHNEYNNLDIKKLKISVLTLRKVRKDLANKKIKDKYNLSNLLKKPIALSCLENNYKSWIAYGIYDFIYLEEKNDITNLDDELIKTINCKSNSELKYFDSKSILMEINNIEGEGVNTNPFTLISNIEIHKSKISNNFFEIGIENKNLLTGYRNLKEAINSITTVLNNNIHMFSKATIYKSLGQKDITLIIENSQIKYLYELLDNLNKSEEINRTFSIFCSNHTNICIDNSSSIVSYIRVPKNSSTKYISELIDIIKQNTKIEAKIYKTTGVMDYRIYWNKLYSINMLFDKYEEMYPYISDYQTKIEKNI